MLKKLFISSVCLACLCFSNIADASVEEALANICAIVKADDKSELRKKIRSVRSDYSIRLKDYYTGISCGSKSLIRVAILNNAIEAGTLLVKNMPKKSLGEPEADGKTLLTWISDEGLSNNPVALVVKERL